MVPLTRLSVVALAISMGCVATPQPDIPEDVDPVDPDQIRIDIGGGHDQLLVTGLDGAADERSRRVRIQNLSSDEVAEVPVAVDGSFTAEIQGAATQVLGVSQFVGDQESPQIFVGGDARSDAVEVGDDVECTPLPEPTPEECLLCHFDGGEEIRGCEIHDFVDEPPHNPANIAGCFFLSTEDLHIELVDPENFNGLGFVNIFNSCGEVLLLDLLDLEAAAPHRFTVFPTLEEGPMPIDPTFFGLIEVFYNGSDRLPGEPLDEAFLNLVVLLPADPEIDLPERPLGEIVLHILVPEI